MRTNNGGSKSDLKPYMRDKKILKTFHGKEARIQNICLLTRYQITLQQLTSHGSHVSLVLQNK